MNSYMKMIMAGPVFFDTRTFGRIILCTVYGENQIIGFAPQNIQRRIEYFFTASQYLKNSADKTNIVVRYGSVNKFHVKCVTPTCNDPVSQANFHAFNDWVQRNNKALKDFDISDLSGNLTFYKYLNKQILRDG